MITSAMKSKLCFLLSTYNILANSPDFNFLSEHTGQNTSIWWTIYEKLGSTIGQKNSIGGSIGWKHFIQLVGIVV